MPFVITEGIPAGTTRDTLIKLRSGIAAVLVEKMNVPKSWVRTFFHVDMLNTVNAGDDECRTIYVRLDTAMFFGKSNVDGLAKSVTTALAKVISDAFLGVYEVEVFIGNLNSAWKTLLPAKKSE